MTDRASVVDTAKGAPDYIRYICPGCRDALPRWPNYHEHRVNLNDNATPGWQWNGSLASPTLTPSVVLELKRPFGTDGIWCDHVCHHFVREGRIEYLGDCTHDLAGQTIDIPEWKESR